MRGRFRSIVSVTAATAVFVYGFAMPAGLAAGLPPGGTADIPAAAETAPAAPQQSAALSIPNDHPEALAPKPAPSVAPVSGPPGTPQDEAVAPNSAPAASVSSPSGSPQGEALAPKPTPSATSVSSLSGSPEGEALAPKPAPLATPVSGPSGAPGGVDGPSTEPKAAESKASAAAKGDAGDKGIDPEPDVAITPPPVAPEASPAPNVNPLDAAKATVVPLPPLNAAIKNALEKREAAEIRGTGATERRKQRDAITAFYAGRSFAPLWSANGVAIPAVQPVIERLAHAADDALSLPSSPAVLNVSGTPDEQAESELSLSEAVTVYARQAMGSRIDPRSIAPLIGLKPVLALPADILKDVADAGTDAGDKLRAFNPTEPRYAALREKLMELRAVHAAPGPLAVIPAGPILHVGMSDPRVPLIRARFSLDGTPDGVPQKLRYDTEVAAAVAGFQKANGLPASGVLTKRTIEALSGGKPSRLEGELVANMEMWRWMPRNLGADRIEVNVPDFAVTVYHGNAAVSTNRVVVGKPTTPTPLFSNTMKFLIVNPVWNVPESIIKKEMLPKLAEDPGYLSEHGYTVLHRNGRLVVRQPSGAKNALGRIKFMFPNDYAVYLHDTPSKSLFATTKRAYSHGCVRVDQPFRFAESVLGQSNGWSQKRLEKMLGNSERYVNLPEPLPIHIEYFTAAVDASGHLNLHDDVYDYVHKIRIALGQEG